MLDTLATVPADQQLVMKLRGAAVMLVFGGIAGYTLRRVLRAIKGDAFIESSPSRHSPWR